MGDTGLEPVTPCVSSNSRVHAEKPENLTYFEAIEKRLKVMDSTALTLCMENNLPIIVFDLFASGSIERIIKGERVGSLVSAKPGE